MPFGRRVVAPGLAAGDLFGMRIEPIAGQGLSNRGIAAALLLIPTTVEHHPAVVSRKRRLRSRVQLARLLPEA